MTEFIAELRQFLEHLPAQILHGVVVVVAAVLVFIILYRLTGYIQRLADRLITRRHPEGGETLARAGARIVWIAGVALSTVVSLGILGIDLGALMAALGLSTLVLGFALKDIIEQAITGTLLLLQRPFRVGDIIQVEGIEGSVVDVAVRTTNLRTFDGIQALIPNNKIYQSVIKNKSYYPARRLALVFGLGSGSDLAAAHGAMLGAVAHVPGVLADPAPEVAFEGWEQDAIRTSVLFWIKSADDPVAMQTAVTQAILDAARHAGLEVRSATPPVVLKQPA
jgi:small conductance mechanosensitive channel